MIIRALGPTLSEFNVPNALANPVLEVYDNNGTSSCVAPRERSEHSPPGAEARVGRFRLETAVS
jgi:hypothetical protein